MLRLYQQEHRNTCAVAALRSVLASQFGVRLPERVLEAFGTTAHAPIRAEGAAAGQLRRMLDEANRAFNTGPRWVMRFRSRGTLPELQRHCRDGRFPLVRGVNDDGQRHFCLVLHVRDGRVRLFDPSYRLPYWLPARAFRRWWRDEGLTWYAVVR